MQIFVKLVAGWSITLEVEMSDTIRILKEKAVAKQPGFKDQLRLVAEGVELNDYCSLSDYSIQQNATLFLMPRLLGGMTIYVKSMTGRTVSLVTKPADKIESIKAKINWEWGIEPEYHR